MHINTFILASKGGDVSGGVGRGTEGGGGEGGEGGRCGKGRGEYASLALEGMDATG